MGVAVCIIAICWIGGIASLAGQDSETEADENPDLFSGHGRWVWAPETHDKQTCRLWRSFHIPTTGEVTRARLRIGVDNGYRLIIDGRDIGTGSDWRSLTEYDLTLILKPGRHVIAVEAFNDNREAGMMLELVIEMSDGKVIRIVSDTQWHIVPREDNGWEREWFELPHWKKAVDVGSMLPRGDKWLERIPSMIVQVPQIQPIEQPIWESTWFQVLMWSGAGVALLLYLRLLTKLTIQSKAQAMLHGERARIARDIHDELGARLTELALEGEVIQTELPEESAARPRLEALCEKARAASGAMDEVVWMVNSKRDTLGDFTNYACKYTQRFLANTAIRCRLDVRADLPEMTLELPVRRNLLLGVKEALNNAVKHSRATEVQLTIQKTGNSIMITVEDNGAGFDLEKLDMSRNGLTNMIDRMRELGGDGRIITKPGFGCCVEFIIPISKTGRRAGSGVGKDGNL